MTKKLSESNIEHMKAVAEEHAKQDAIADECVTAKNAHEATVFQFQDKLSSMNLNEATKKQVEAKLAEE